MSQLGFQVGQSVEKECCFAEMNTLMVITGNTDHNARRGEIQMIPIPGRGGSEPSACRRRRQHPISGSVIMGTLLRNSSSRAAIL